MDSDILADAGGLKQFVETCSECGRTWLVLMRHEPENKCWVYLTAADAECPSCAAQPKEEIHG